MAELVRKIHLYSGLSLMAFVVMYFFSGMVIVHHGWFPSDEPEKSSRVESPGNGAPQSPAALSIYLQDHFGLRGKRQPPRQLKDGAWSYGFYHPGTYNEAVLSAQGDQVTITTTRQPLRQTIVGYHRILHYGGGWLYDLWVFMYDAASAGCIVFGITGILIWFETKRDLAGWIFLGTGWGLTVAMVLYLMLMP